MRSICLKKNLLMPQISFSYPVQQRTPSCQDLMLELLYPSQYLHSCCMYGTTYLQGSGIIIIITI